MNPQYLRNKVNELLNKTEGTKVLWVSGGVDSMVLLDSVKRRKDIEVVHFHHGDNSNKEFRDSAQGLVEKFCSDFNIVCQVVKNTSDKISETDMRNFRNSHIEEGKTVVSAHHADDLLETRLISLIKGKNLESLEVNSMKLKPLEAFTKKEIYEYAQKNDVPFVEDPTNKESDNLRNYIRNEMIPNLEKFHPNFQVNFARNLSKITKC